MAERYSIEFVIHSERPRTSDELDKFAAEVLEVMNRHKFGLWLEPEQNECIRIRRQRHIALQ